MCACVCVWVWVAVCVSVCVSLCLSLSVCVLVCVGGWFDSGQFAKCKANPCLTPLKAKNKTNWHVKWSLCSCLYLLTKEESDHFTLWLQFSILGIVLLQSFWIFQENFSLHMVFACVTLLFLLLAGLVFLRKNNTQVSSCEGMGSQSVVVCVSFCPGGNS